MPSPLNPPPFLHNWLQVVKQTYPALRELGLDSSCWLWPGITQASGAAEQRLQAEQRPSLPLRCLPVAF